jgi:outer membrane receptor protein involved in Fe transport
MLSGNTYYRKSNRHTKNGDLYESEMDAGDPHEIYGSGLTCEDASGECELKGSVLNTTHTKQDNYGLAGQVTFNQDFMGKKNQFIVGTGFDYSLIRFKQNERVNISDESEGTVGGSITPAETVFDSTREAILSGAGLLPQTQTTGLKGKQWTASLFATDTLSLNDKWHLNAGVRYNHTKVDNDDTLRGALSPRTLTAVDDYKRLNPSIGITHTPTDRLSIFGTYSESSRAPTSIELGCSNPAYGCLLPSAMADDPPLKQVVAKTYDFGARGSLTEEIKWNASIYHAMNHQDLQFIRAGNSTSRGYYSNVGRTERQGLDLGLGGQHDRFRWNASYSYIRATFDSDFSLVNSANSSAPDSGVDKSIYNVTKGNRMPSIPAHQFKARAQYDVTPQWSVGTNLVYFSNQYVMGNENNKHEANTADCLNSGSLRGNDRACGSGKISDYTLVNLDTQYNFGGGWKAFAKAINIFDNHYYVAGRLAETMFDASGAYNDEIKSRGVIPGAPRAAWVGFRYEFGGAPEAK